MNSLYNPVDSLVPILHNPNPVTYICANCNQGVHFDKHVRRWLSNDSLSLLCKKAGK